MSTIPWWERVAMWLTARIGSFGVEVLSGLAFATGAETLELLPGGTWLERLAGKAVVATVGSFYYERKVDPNGFSWADVLQRMVGILVGLACWLGVLSLVR